MAGRTSLGTNIHAIRQEMEVNYFAPSAIVQQGYSEQFQKKAATRVPTAIVNINSIASFFNSPFSGATYSASKAAAHSITQAQRRDLPGTLVMGVYPGPIGTDMGQDIPFEKTSPSTVANAIVDALLTGSTTELFPDSRSRQLFAEYQRDPVSFQVRMGQF